MDAARDFRSFIFSPIVIFVVRCLIGFSIGFFLMKQFPQYDFFWALLSIMLVISPEGKDSPRLTTERVKANLIGALSGFVVVFLPFSLFIKAIIAITVTAIICNAIKLLDVSRSAIVAVIIILIEKPDEGYLASVERFSFVLIGCLIGLIVVVTTGYMIRFVHKKLLKAEYKLKNLK